MGQEGGQRQRCSIAASSATRPSVGTRRSRSGAPSRRKQWLCLVAMLLSTGCMSSALPSAERDTSSTADRERRKARRLRRGIQAFSVSLGRPVEGNAAYAGGPSPDHPSGRTLGFFGLSEEPSEESSNNGTDSAKYHPDKGSFSVSGMADSQSPQTQQPSASSYSSGIGQGIPLTPVGSTSREAPRPENTPDTPAQATPAQALEMSGSPPPSETSTDDGAQDDTSTTTTTTTSSQGPTETTPASEEATEAPLRDYDANNTVQVSLSLALPLTWNLSSPEHAHSVELLVEEVSNAATIVFHSTLDNAITLLESSPSRIETSKSSEPDGAEKHRAPTSTMPLVNGTNSSSMMTSSDVHNITADYNSTDGDAAVRNQSSSLPSASTVVNMTWDYLDVNATMDYNNGTMVDDDLVLLSMMPDDDNDGVDTTATPAPSSDTMLWDWLEMAPLSKEDLYHMVLEYLEIEEEDLEEGGNSTSDTGSPLLQDLKEEIRQAIYSFFFDDDDVDDLGSPLEGNMTLLDDDNNTTDANAWHPDHVNDTDHNSHNNQLNNQSSHNDDSMTAVDDDMVVMADRDNDPPPPLFASSGIWEMFLADTRVELVYEEDDYAWWKLTMIYPVYVHHHAVQDDYQDFSDLTIDNGGVHRALRSVFGDGAVAAFNMGSGPPINGTSAAPPTADRTKNSNQPYWVPVQEQGTLDFIGRFLQRVLAAAVVSGAFLTQMLELAEFDVGDDDDLVHQIIALATPGSEHDLDFLFEDDTIEIGDDFFPKIPETVAPTIGVEEPGATVEGTFTHGLLDDDSNNSHARLGLGMLLTTLATVMGIVLSATLRRRTAETRATERQEVWFLKTEQDVAELLQVGWTHKEVPVHARKAASCSDVEAPSSPTHRAEVFEVFDKGGAGYYDNDSMLHGSAMQHSFGGTESDVGMRHIPAPPKGWLRTTASTQYTGWQDLSLD